MSYLEEYFRKTGEEKRSKAAIAFFASIDVIATKSPLVATEIINELKDQRSHLKLIASENYSSMAVQLAMGNLFTDKYSEGSVGRRFYAGCEHVDQIEGEAVRLAKKIFSADHAYCQPHSGADANLIAFWSILIQRVQNKEVEKLSKKTVDELTDIEHEHVRKLIFEQKIMGMSLNSGGHLTHGYRHNVTSKMLRSHSYEIDFETGRINYTKLREQVKQVKPLILIAGYSAYTRLIDFAIMREIADSVGAILVVDMAHFAGLVAGGVMKGNENPIPFAHIVTSTTHKTLRGPRGGLILCKDEFKEMVDRGCPLVMGGPLPHVMAAKAVAFKEADTAEFSDYAHQIVANSKALAEELMRLGIKVLTGGTDNHIVLIDTFSSFGLTGRQAELALRRAKITSNRNSIPQDQNGAWYTSGIRLGTAAITTLGMKQEEMKQLAKAIEMLLKHTLPKESKAKFEIDEKALQKCTQLVQELLEQFPLYPELVLQDEQNNLKKTNEPSIL